MGAKIKNTLIAIFLFAIVFTLGWTANSISAASERLSVETPLTTITGQISAIKTLTTGIVDDVPNPKDRIKESQIHVTKNNIEIDLADSSWTILTPTKSMDPTFDAGANTVRILPKSPEDLQVGDIISYETENGIVIHRIDEIGNDGEWYAKTKGDNLPFRDPDKVRFWQILGVLVAIFY